MTSSNSLPSTFIGRRFDTSTFHKVVALGKSRCGTVFLCRDSSGDLHAVKTIPRSKVASKSDIVTLFMEKDILQRVSSLCGFAKLRGTANNELELSFILEPVLGGPLYKHIRANFEGKLELHAAIFYAAEVLCAMVDMHALEIIHRDIKSSNIIIDSLGHVKIIDMGCAVLMTGRERTFTYCGTLHCMAPEMVARSGHSYPVDLWALGILLYEMLAGHAPFPYSTGEPASDLEIVRLISTSTTESLPFSPEVFCSRTFDKNSTKAQATLNLMKLLLVPLPSDRIGYRNSADVLKHSCFDGLDLDCLRQHLLEPPKFRKDLGELDIVSVDEHDVSIDQSLFDGF